MDNPFVQLYERIAMLWPERTGLSLRNQIRATKEVWDEGADYDDCKGTG
jgi:hypothetical protein